MDTARNLPVIVWCDGDRVVAECVLIPRCRVERTTRDQALAAVQRLIATRLRARRSEGWDLPASYEVGHVPTNGCALPSRRTDAA